VIRNLIPLGFFFFNRCHLIRPGLAENFFFRPTDPYSYVPCVLCLLADYSSYRRVWGSGVGLGSAFLLYVPCVRYSLFNISVAGAHVDPERGKESFVFFLA
jgi:hypothetical protein